MCLASAQGSAQPVPRVPDANGLKILVRTTIVALGQANSTGNYTVFRDLGAPGFQKANTPAKLGGIFSGMRAKKLDFGPVVLFDPTFTKQPAINERGMLRLTGYFPTRPLRVHFDLVYQWVENRWRLFGIAAQAKQAPPQPAAAKKKR